MNDPDHLHTTRNFLNRLGSPLFLVSLVLLLLNDFVLKPNWPGFLTGKLSDFAGLFAFGFFWCSLAPSRKRLVLISLALFFIWWKSAWSQPVIDIWNAWSWPAMGRTVDPSDYLAIPILLLVPVALARSRPVVSYRLGQVAILGVSLFAFLATSPKAVKVAYDDQAPDYQFAINKQDFLLYLEEAEFLESGKSEKSKGPWPEQFTVEFTGNYHEYGAAKILVAQVGEGTVIWLRELKLSYWLANRLDNLETGDRSSANEVFESLFVNEVRDGISFTSRLLYDR
jgi:hypothetical protein